MTRYKKTVAMDFDGVLHAYTSPWTKATEINDGPTPGALEAVLQYLDADYEVVVYSSRANDPEGRLCIQDWLEDHGFPGLEVTSKKPAAILYIDDRGYTFTGSNFPSVDYLRSFKPWNK